MKNSHFETATAQSNFLRLSEHKREVTLDFKRIRSSHYECHLMNSKKKTNLKKNTAKTQNVYLSL